MFVDSEAEITKEIEPTPIKTGLDLIEMAVGSYPKQWFKLHLDHNELSLELNLVGKEGIRGKFRKSIVVTPDKESMEVQMGDFLEGLGVERVTAQRLKEEKAKGRLLVFTEEGKEGFIAYTFPEENFQKLMGEIREADRKASKDRNYGHYSLSTLILHFDFPSSQSHENYSHRVQLPEEFTLGRIAPLMKEDVVRIEKLEDFLVENWHYFEALFGNWQG